LVNRSEIIPIKKNLVGTQNVYVTSVLSNYQSLTADNFFIITKSAYIQSYGGQYTIGQLTYTAATGQLHINGDLTNGDRYMITYDIYYIPNPLP
jgi:hypothetical protein